jgi:hypothetical protein
MVEEVNVDIREDHHPAALTLRLTTNKCSDYKSKFNEPSFNKAMLNDTSAVTAFLRDVRDVVPIPWELDVHRHWHRLWKQITLLMQKHFPLPARTIRQPYITECTFEVILFKKQLKNEMDNCNDDDTLQWIKGMHNSADIMARDLVKQDKVNYIEANGVKAAQVINGKEAKQITAALQPFRGAAGRKSSTALRPQAGYKNESGVPLCTFGEVQDTFSELWSKLEAGKPTTLSKLASKVASDQQAKVQCVAKPELRDIPSLMDLEASLRRAANNKASNGGIPGDIPKLDINLFAQLLMPLHMKISTLVQEPIQFKGGEAFGLYRGRGDPTVISQEAYRTILVSAPVGKRLKSTFRPKLLPYTDTYFQSKQVGGLPH